MNFEKSKADMKSDKKGKKMKESSSKEMARDKKMMSGYACGGRVKKSK